MASILYCRSPSSPGQPLRSNTIQLNDDPPPNGAVPMLPMFESQSLSVQLGPEINDVQVEGANTPSDAVIFSPKHKVKLLRTVPTNTKVFLCCL